MPLNSYLYEQLVVAHQQELQREMEQHRMLARLPRQHSTRVQLAVGRLGTLLVELGTRLKQAEQDSEPAMP
jgi:hypothetical protein